MAPHLLRLTLDLVPRPLHSPLQRAHHLQRRVKLPRQRSASPASHYPAQQATCQHGARVRQLATARTTCCGCLPQCSKGGTEVAQPATLVQPFSQPPARKDVTKNDGCSGGGTEGSLRQR